MNRIDADKYSEHKKLCDSIHLLYLTKNRDYGDSFAKARKEIPNYTLGKLYDKFQRYMNLTLKGENTARVEESLDDTLMDLANYAVMEVLERAYDRSVSEEESSSGKGETE